MDKEIPKTYTFQHYSGGRRAGLAKVYYELLLSGIKKMKPGETIAIVSVGETRILRLEEVRETSV